MGSWSYSDCLMALFVVHRCFVGILGDELECPSSLLTQNGTQLKLVSRKNQTEEEEFCGASLETICFQDPTASGACQILVNLSVSSVAEEDQVVEFDLTLLATLQHIGRRQEIWCNVTDLAKDPSFSNKLFTVNWWLDYDCCDKWKSQENYFARLSVSYRHLEPCEAVAIVMLKPDTKEVSSPAKVIVPKANDSTSTENFLMPIKAYLHTGLVAAVVMAVLVSGVTIIVIYIVCVKCDGGQCLQKRYTGSCQFEQTLLKNEIQDCLHCKIEKVEVNAPKEDSIGCSTIEIDIIPPVTLSSSSSSDEELTQDKLDSGWYE